MTDVAITVNALSNVPAIAASVSAIQTLTGWIGTHDTGTPGGSTGATSITSSPSMSGAARKFSTSYTYGEEAQVDYGEGALTRVTNGKLRRPYLFVMTLKFSGKCFRKVTWKTSQQIWAAARASLALVRREPAGTWSSTTYARASSRLTCTSRR